MQLSRRGRAVDVVLLGALEVRAAGRMVPLGQRQQRHVFTVLAVEVDRLVPADALIDRVWGDDPPAGARRTLQIHVARLRRALTPVGGAGSR